MPSYSGKCYDAAPRSVSHSNIDFTKYQLTQFPEEDRRRRPLVPVHTIDHPTTIVRVKKVLRLSAAYFAHDYSSDRTTSNRAVLSEKLNTTTRLRHSQRCRQYSERWTCGKPIHLIASDDVGDQEWGLQVGI